MRKNRLLFLMLLLSVGCSSIKYGQSVILDTAMVPVYEHCFGKKVSGFVDNTKSHENEDWYYETVILDKRMGRYYVSIQLFEDHDVLQKSQSGWVDRENCKVFPRCDKYIDGKPLLYLYSDPFTNAIRDSLLYDSFLDMEMYTVTSIHKRSDRIRVEIDYNGEKYNGWTRRFCSNVYDSCN